ncbi:GNAT family N-acetyltransferase [Brevibacterium yomogidense]|uniref:GNAT family N-acetyltransferase n=1 Tax=Brevibacterium yomogidense TaxID=946573 RepID=UPI0018E03042|nr:GNAT family N-acetyltransferase [Brevibacterium yomogidense]
MAEPTKVPTRYDVTEEEDRMRIVIRDLSGDTPVLVGFLEYRMDGDVRTILHTIIDEAYSRQGWARTLVTEALALFARDDAKIRSMCSYVDRYLERFPQYRTMLA